MAQPDGSTLKEWLADFELDQPLTAQTHCVTIRAKRKRDGRAVTIRALRTTGRGTKAARHALGRERDVLSSVDHPVLPAVLETREHDSQLALIIADHGGFRVDAVLDRVAQAPPLSAIAIAIEIGRALTALHRIDEPHGALRAEQVELTPQGAVYLHGSGQRHHLSLRGAEDQLTLPEHMAPEQILGDAPDERSDVFLLGMLLYRMVAGRSAFDASDGSISHHIRHSAPRPLNRYVSAPPEGLERILSRCLEKRARDRYSDVSSVVSELVRVLRSHTSLSTEVLVSRWLADASLAEAVPGPRERGVARGAAESRIGWRKAALPLAIAALVVVVAVVVWRSLTDGPSSGPSDPRGIVKRPARLRILARPWAEVHIDGKLVDTTPIGFPIEVVPGRHTVVFKHPNAPDEARSVEIIAGQTILLTVEMQITRPQDAGAPEASVVQDDSP